MIDCICGSPRKKDSASFELLSMLDLEKRILFSASLPAESRTVILSFPLYFDGIPAMFLKELETLSPDYENVYAICNCGYYEGRAASPAFSVLRAFCARTGRRFLGGVGIGAGALATMFRRLSPALHPHKKAHAALRELSRCAARALPYEVSFFEPAVPKRLYMRSLNALFRIRAKRLRP